MAESASQNFTPQKPFGWTAIRIEAAILVAEDRLTNAEIAQRCGISEKTLSTWKKHPDFVSQVDELLAELQERARKRGLARLDKRQDVQFDRHRRMVDLIEARTNQHKDHGEDAATGVVVRELKSVTVRYERDPSKPDSQPFTVREEVYEHTFDAALMRELRELEKQIAQDAGQWSEKRSVEHSGTVTFADIIDRAIAIDQEAP